MSNGLHRIMLSAFLGLGCFVATWVPAMAGELPKEGPISATFVNEGRVDAMQIGDEQWAWTNYARTATVGDSEGDLLHNMSGDCMGMGVNNQGSGYCRHVDADGDMIFERWQDVDIGKGTATFLGGTGKYAGITGTLEYDYVMLPSPEGALHLAGKTRGSYKLP